MNKKGFAISSIIYSILILFLALIAGILGLLASRKLILDKLKNDVISKLNNQEVVSVLYKDNSGASIPELYEKMIPIVYKDGNWVYADVYSKWYDYDLKEWANAVVLNNGVTKKVGDVISESDIALWYVWVPRYKYKLFNDGNYTSAITVNTAPTTSAAQEIEIVFESKSTPKSVTTTVGKYLTHPAFTFGNKELNGIWVGKFESSNYSGDGSTLTIKPNVSSWRNINVYNAFVASQNATITYSLSNSDSHMMKNIEWGSVAYLSHSKFGINDEIRINNNSNHITGCGASVHNASGTTNCDITFGNSTEYPQSTTGNITGIFDMSGGSWEYVSGYRKNTYGSSGFNSSNIGDSKYFDVYSENTNQAFYNHRILGDSTGELGEFYYYPDSDNVKKSHNIWYNDYSQFVDGIYPWFVRGGRYDGGVISGQFAFYSSPGIGAAFASFRSVLVEK